MFVLVREPIDVAAWSARLDDPTAGAVTSFEGRVRNHANGREVTGLAYEAYDALAAKEGERILAEARERFDVARVACVHRVGRLAVGDVAVWVGVAAAHRGDAFAACRYVIDELKGRVPIWKKESYAEGESAWIDATSTETASV